MCCMSHNPIVREKKKNGTTQKVWTIEDKEVHILSHLAKLFLDTMSDEEHHVSKSLGCNMFYLRLNQNKTVAVAVAVTMTMTMTMTVIGTMTVTMTVTVTLIVTLIVTVVSIVFSRAGDMQGLVLVWEVFPAFFFDRTMKNCPFCRRWHGCGSIAWLRMGTKNMFMGMFPMVCVRVSLSCLDRFEQDPVFCLNSFWARQS